MSRIHSVNDSRDLTKDYHGSTNQCSLYAQIIQNLNQIIVYCFIHNLGHLVNLIKLLL